MKKITSIISLIIFLIIGAIILYPFLNNKLKEPNLAILKFLQQIDLLEYKVDFDDLVVDGYLWNKKFTFKNFSISFLNSERPWKWEAENIKAKLSPEGLEFRIVGEQLFTYSRFGEITELRFAASKFKVTSSNTSKTTSLFFDISNAFIDYPSNEKHVRIGKFQLRLDRKPGDEKELITNNSNIEIYFSNLTLPDLRNGPLGDNIARFQAQVLLESPISSGDILQSLREWRNSNGRVVITDLQALWGTLDLSARSGSIRLDELLRPTGNFMGIVKGYEITIDAFHAARRISDESMTEINGMLNFMRQAGGRIGGEIALPIEIINGNVIVGKAILGKVFPLVSSF